MEIPINLKLKRKMHKDIAYAQDIIVEELYKFFPDAVIHGGTAIWRCYGGNRFSEDVDVYIKKNKEKTDLLFENFKKRGFLIVKRKLTENTLYSTLSFNKTLVRLEALFKEEKRFLKEYETSDGLLINVYTLTPEKLIEEKVETYIKRRKIRDLYDIFFLLRYVKDRETVIKHVKRLVVNFENPIDEESLRTILISPPIPKTEELQDYISKWAK